MLCGSTLGGYPGVAMSKILYQLYVKVSLLLLAVRAGLSSLQIRNASMSAGCHGTDPEVVLPSPALLDTMYARLLLYL